MTYDHWKTTEPDPDPSLRRNEYGDGYDDGWRHGYESALHDTGAAIKRPDWNNVYRDAVKPLDIDRANELVPVTRESLRLCVGLLIKCMAEDYYHNFGAAHAEICAALDAPSALATADNH